MRGSLLHCYYRCLAHHGFDESARLEAARLQASHAAYVAAFGPAASREVCEMDVGDASQWLDGRNRLALTLMVLHLDLSDETAGAMWGLREATVFRIFVHTVRSLDEFFARTYLPLCAERSRLLTPLPVLLYVRSRLAHPTAASSASGGVASGGVFAVALIGGPRDKTLAVFHSIGGFIGASDRVDGHTSGAALPRAPPQVLLRGTARSPSVTTARHPRPARHSSFSCAVNDAIVMHYPFLAAFIPSGALIYGVADVFSSDSFTAQAAAAGHTWRNATLSWYLHDGDRSLAASARELVCCSLLRAMKIYRRACSRYHEYGMSTLPESTVLRVCLFLTNHLQPLDTMAIAAMRAARRARAKRQRWVECRREAGSDSDGGVDDNDFGRDFGSIESAADTADEYVEDAEEDSAGDD